MRRATTVWIRGGLVALALAWALIGQGAAPPPLGQLSGEQKARLKALDVRVRQAAESGRLAEALRLARELAAQRQRWQGWGHWETVDSRLDVERWQRLVGLSRQQQRRVGVALRREKVAEESYGGGRYREMVSAFREALAVWRKILGEDHPDTALCLSTLGLGLEKQGKHAEALPLFREALAILRKLLGEQHAWTAYGYNNLAGCLHSQGQQGKALPLFRKALEIRRKVLGEEHPWTAESCNNVAIALDRLGKHADALPLYEKALLIQREVRGEGHPDTAQSYRNVAGCLDYQGKHGDALPLHRKARAICRETLGELHPQTASISDSMALCLDRQGKHGEALPLFREALAILCKLLGEEHPLTARSYGNVAGCLNAQGASGEALPLLVKALAIRRKVLGEDHSDTAESCNNLAVCLDQMGKHADALPLFRSALRIHRKVYGEDHPLAARSRDNLAACLDWQGKHADALPLHQKGLAGYRKALGEGHPYTAHGYHNVAMCLDHLGEHADALPFFQKAVTIQRKLLGEEHPDTASSYNDLGFCHSKMGQHRAALRCWRAALLGCDCGRLGSATSGFERSLFRARFLTPRSGLAATYAHLKEAEKAWQYAEADLARGLLDDLLPSNAAGQDRELLVELGQMDQRLLPLLGLAKRTEDQERLYEELTRRRRGVLTRLSLLAAGRSAAAVLSLDRIQKQIPGDAALVLWVDAPSQHWGCVLRRDGPPRWERLPGSGRDGAWTVDDVRLTERLSRALTDLREAPARRDALVRAVRRQCLAPLGQHLRAQGSLPAVRRLVVVPTGRMARVPVEILAPDCTVSYVPSGTLLARLKEQHRGLSGASLLALGDPVFAPVRRPLPPSPRRGLLVRLVAADSNAGRAGVRPGDVLLSYRGTTLDGPDDLRPLLAQRGRARVVLWRDGERRTVSLEPGELGTDLDPRSAPAAVRAWRRAEEPLARGGGYQSLPGTRLEVEALRRLVGPERTTRLLGPLASAEQLERISRAGRLAHFRLLHLATHGAIDEDNPARSALILSAHRTGPKGPGRLTARTILEQWRLDCDLVVLSACETALGGEGGGNGLVGFAHTFLARGARAVVLSRWKVDDTATALLMERFYEDLLGKREGLEKGMGRAEALAEAKKWLAGLNRKQAEELAARLSSGGLRGTEGDARPLVKGRPARLPEGERPFAHPYYWAAFVLMGDPD